MARIRPTVTEAFSLIQTWYRDGLRAVDPRRAVARSISLDGNRLIAGSQSVELQSGGRLVAVAIGKAACEMAHGLDDALGGQVSRGVILTKDGHASRPPADWDVYEASHPVPDERGVAATGKILLELGSLTDDDVAIVLVSGGGSALLESPREGIALSDIQETTRLMLHAGAPIHHLNAVRSELSKVKGGGLRRSVGAAACLSIIHSDVLGNDPALIASGPTIDRTPDPQAALDLLNRYELGDQTPLAVRALLRSASPPETQPDHSRDAFVIVGDNDELIDAISRLAERDGLRTTTSMRLTEGEAQKVATRFIAMAEAQPAEMEVVIGGGEATVTVRGRGRGGRNTEFSLSAAIVLHQQGLDWVVASLASDGQDGSIDAAGAIVDRRTVDRGSELGLDAWAYLDNNDSGGYFERLGALVKPGPTGANVNDVYIAVRVTEALPDLVSGQ